MTCRRNRALFIRFTRLGEFFRSIGHDWVRRNEAVGGTIPPLLLVRDLDPPNIADSVSGFLAMNEEQRINAWRSNIWKASLVRLLRFQWIRANFALRYTDGSICRLGLFVIAG